MSTSEPPEQDRPRPEEPRPEEPRPEEPRPEEPRPEESRSEGARPEEQPTVESPKPAAEHTAAAAPPAAAAQPAAAQPAGTAGRRTTRRWPWVVGGVAALVIALVIGGGIGFAVGHHGRPDHRIGHSMYRGAGGAAGFGPQGMHGPGERQHGRFGGARQTAGTTGLVGTVTSVNGANLVVTQDGGGPVTLTTSAQTRVAGEQQRAVTDLKPGDRVAVRVGPNNTAVGVRVVPAAARGTITTLNGTQATVTSPDGLTRAVDTSGLATQPKAGDLVAVVGTSADNGATLKAQTLRELPKAS